MNERNTHSLMAWVWTSVDITETPVKISQSEIDKTFMTPVYYPGILNSECILSLLKYLIYLGKRKWEKYGRCEEKKNEHKT